MVQKYCFYWVNDYFLLKDRIQGLGSKNLKIQIKEDIELIVERKV